MYYKGRFDPNACRLIKRGSLTAVTFRSATRADLETIVELLVQDELGQTREQADDAVTPAYVAAFETIAADPHNEVIVGEDADGIVGTMQLTFIANLTFQGATRCQIEGVRIAERARGQGLGQEMIRWAVAQARARRCRIVQLTSNKARERAIAFYEQLGFEASHVGFKLYLDPE